MQKTQTPTKQRKSCVSCVSLLRDTQIRKALWDFASTIDNVRENPMVGIGWVIVREFQQHGENTMAYAVEEVTDIQDRVITEIQTGRSLRQVCKDDGMPDFRTVQRWIVSDAQFAVKYARARMAQADTLFDRMEEVEEQVSAGTMDSHAARVVLDSMRWRASKLAPKVYGDRLDVSVTDNRISITSALQAAQSRLLDVTDAVPRIAYAENANKTEGPGRADDQ